MTEVVEDHNPIVSQLIAAMQELEELFLSAYRLGLAELGEKIETVYNSISYVKDTLDG